MIFPIVAYGAPILRKVAKEISADYPGLSTLIEDMWETMYESNGVGLAAPQINKDIRLFVVDSTQIFQHLEESARIEDLSGDEWPYNEGCLSIPKIREDVYRKEQVTITYQDEFFTTHTETYKGITARVILHEYDHIEGKLFIDYLSPFRRKLMQGKLKDISKGNIKVDYKMIFPG
jgi:peptide deformylase